MSSFGDKTNLPFTANDSTMHWSQRGKWPARWLEFFRRSSADTVCCYRCVFSCETTQQINILVSGDHKYRLFLDGVMLGMGPELGDANSYFYESYQLNLLRGEHRITALVFDFQGAEAYCQVSLRPGFLLAAENTNPEFLNTGFAAWEVKSTAAMQWTAVPVLYPNVIFDAKNWPADILQGLGEEWQKAIPAELAAHADIRNEFAPERLMRPATLPPRYYEPLPMVNEILLCNPESEIVESMPGSPGVWGNWYNHSQAVVIPPHSRVRVIGKLTCYHCVYPVLQTFGGAGSNIKMQWAESLYQYPGSENNDAKGNREQIEGKYFRGCHDSGDQFFPAAGEMTFFTPWWRAGRFFELFISTAGEELILRKITLFDCRYPLEAESTHHTDNEQLNRILDLCFRTLQMCCHDTFMDCPYYEQLMYIGDARIEALVTLVSTEDDRMVQKMLRLFASSQLPSGFLHSRYPSRVCQIIPTFSLIWIMALHDYALFRRDRPCIIELLGCAKKIISAFEHKINRDGLLEFAQGWNFMDWTARWSRTVTECGIPPNGEYGVSLVINLLYSYVLRHLAELCDYAGEPECGTFYLRRGKEITELLINKYYVSERGLFVETSDDNSVSEHAQCLAILSGFLPKEIEQKVCEGLYTEQGFDETSISFSHYYFECCRITGRMDSFFRRMHLWFDCDNLGLSTLLERPEPSRSDCHAWSSHPYFHISATIGGIRPAEFEFTRVQVKPQLGELKYLHTEMVHPTGKIIAVYRRTETQALNIEITLPAGLVGELSVGEQVFPLHYGQNIFERLAETTASQPLGLS